MKNYSFIILFIAILSLAASFRSPGRTALTLTGGTFEKRNFQFQGLNRHYLVYIPTHFNPSKRVPLVLFLHGGFGNAKRSVRLTLGKWNQLADSNNFLVVYPEAIDKHWNDGRNVSHYKSQRENIDDVGFLSQLIDEMIQRDSVDASRVYVTGISNGGIMSYRLGCELTRKLAAIAPIIGSIAENEIKQCKPCCSLPVLAMNGTADPLVPFEGGAIRGFGGKTWKDIGRVISAPQSVQFWAQQNHCSLTPVVEQLPDRDPNDKTHVRVERYNPIQGNSEVLFYIIEGGGHTLPGGRQYAPAWLVGHVSHQIDSVQVIWDFFKRHHR